MSSQGLFIEALATGLSTIILIGIVLAVKAMKKGVDKVKDLNQLRNDELYKMDNVVQKIESIDIFPVTGKVESINFFLNENDESLFYAIPPSYLKRLRKKLELLAKNFKESDLSYGYQYAERHFYIGNKLIFSWKNEINL